MKCADLHLCQLHYCHVNMFYLSTPPPLHTPLHPQHFSHQTSATVAKQQQICKINQHQNLSLINQKLTCALTPYSLVIETECCSIQDRCN